MSNKSQQSATFAPQSYVFKKKKKSNKGMWRMKEIDVTRFFRHQKPPAKKKKKIQDQKF